MADSKDPWYVQHSEIGKAFSDFYRAANEKSALDPKTRELLMLALACVFRCPHCTESHLKRALEVGATKQEVSDALLIAAVEGAGTQLAWQGELFARYLSKE